MFRKKIENKIKRIGILTGSILSTNQMEGVDGAR
jgi:hypothetical protein